jgi:hypothetical protein
MKLVIEDSLYENPKKGFTTVTNYSTCRNIVKQKPKSPHTGIYIIAFAECVLGLGEKYYGISNNKQLRCKLFKEMDDSKEQPPLQSQSPLRSETKLN